MVTVSKPAALLPPPYRFWNFGSLLITSKPTDEVKEMPKPSSCRPFLVVIRITPLLAREP